ncbi:unnamed protein product, partial [Effrenium voratum]
VSELRDALFQDASPSCSSFTAIKMKRRGRTSDGHSCDCTDKPKKKEMEASPLNLFAKEEKSTDQLAKELERERQQAERENADQEMGKAFGDFELEKADYDQAMADVETAWQDFAAQKPKYETAFWLTKAIHDTECQKLMDDHHLVDAECHKNWLTAREEYFARVLAPQCVKGETAAFEFQVPSSLAVLAPCSTNARRRGQMRCFL